MLDTVWRSLSSPGGAGADRRDRPRQHAQSLRPRGKAATSCCRSRRPMQVTGQRLRPDAVVFLPGDERHRDRLQGVEIPARDRRRRGQAAERGEAYADLAPHHEPASEGARRQGLSRRGAGRVARRAGRGGDVARIVSVMYLPNEAALEKLCRADPRVPAARRARRRSSRPGRPGCIALLSLAAVEINRSARSKTSSASSTRRRRCSTASRVALGHAAAVGKGIKAAADSFQKFDRLGQPAPAAPRAPPRQARRGRGQALPPNLPAYNVVEPRERSPHRGRGGGDRPEPPAPAADRGIDFTARPSTAGARRARR